MATPVALAKRADTALARIESALGDTVRVRHRDAMLERTLQLEAIASAMETVVTAEIQQAEGYFTIDDVLERLSAIDGFGPSTLAKVRKALS